MQKAKPYEKKVLETHRRQKNYTGRKALQIAFPLGGIGAGSVSLNGQGGLQDFSIRHQPAITALPEGPESKDAAFALLNLPDLKITRLVEGPMPKEKIYNLGLKTQGYEMGGFEGLPRFRKSVFHGEYPFGTVTLTDPTIPLQVSLRGWNPFIPLDDVNSGIPCAILEYTFKNLTQAPVRYQFSYHLSHLAPGADLAKAPNSRNALIPGVGVQFTNVECEESVEFGSAALGVIGGDPKVKAMWLRGGWYDSISALWREVCEAKFSENDGSQAAFSQGRNGGSILLTGELKSGAQATHTIVISWYFPNVGSTYGQGQKQTSVSVDNNVCGCQSKETRWHPFYAGQWRDAADVLGYVKTHYSELRKQTEAFHRALFRSTLPDYVLEAVSANLAILKSPTVLRQKNGNVWGWEGCHPDHGCCYGSCTHVWNYAFSMASLFPALERTLREQEMMRSMDEQGHVNFRSALPDGGTHHTFHAAADGQLGGIMKVYREWQISGDRSWLERMAPLAQRSMDYCIETWDPERRGLVVEPHHNTYDIEFWGADGMCSSFYLGALQATAQLLQDAGQSEAAQEYANLAARGARAMDEQLFNGEYFEQKVDWDNLRERSFAELIATVTPESPEDLRLLKAEGPRYQYGHGCISDGVFGAWLARLCGVRTPQSEEHIRRHLESIFAYNFKDNLWEHANTQRPGFAWGDEAGLLLCTWPKDGKPTLPFVYSDEVWTGIEYQVAGHLIASGHVAEGLTIVKALRSRYDGETRNPWNEYECGSFYARAMASYGLLEALSGFHYSLATRELHLAPRLNDRPLRCFFSTATGWGTVVIHEKQIEIQLEQGELKIDHLLFDRGSGQVEIKVNQIARAGKRLKIDL
jgi:uncharacterized protein (DUF608 family)